MTKRICHLMFYFPCLLLLSYPDFSPQRIGRVTVLEVQDGDSIILLINKNKIRLRMNFIDAPEMDQRPAGENAKKYLTHIIKNCKEQLSLDRSGIDQYGRVLGELWCGKMSLNLAMIKSGHATVYIYAKFQNRGQKREYLNALKLARLKKIGFWREGIVNPYHWRAARKKASLPKRSRIRQNRRVSFSKEGKGFQ